jgi:phosphate transport system ATP-binding protein
MSNRIEGKQFSRRSFLGLMGEMVEAGPTMQIFEDPQDTRTKDYVSGRFG